LTAQLDERPRSLFLVEIHQLNTAEVLALVASASRIHPDACFAALVDRGLVLRDEYSLLADALYEAGVQGITTSPRQLLGILELGRRFANLTTSLRTTADESIAAHVQALLPWQGH
jgi:hypothetical protein